MTDRKCVVFTKKSDQYCVYNMSNDPFLCRMFGFRINYYISKNHIRTVLNKLRRRGYSYSLPDQGGDDYMEDIASDVIQIGSNVEVEIGNKTYKVKVTSSDGYGAALLNHKKSERYSAITPNGCEYFHIIDVDNSGLQGAGFDYKQAYEDLSAQFQRLEMLDCELNERLDVIESCLDAIEQYNPDDGIDLPYIASRIRLFRKGVVDDDKNVVAQQQAVQPVSQPKTKNAKSKKPRMRSGPSILSGLRQKYPNDAIVIKEGIFYDVYDQDAIELNKLLGYQISNVFGRDSTGGPSFYKIKDAFLKAGKSVVLYEKGNITTYPNSGSTKNTSKPSVPNASSAGNVSNSSGTGVNPWAGGVWAPGLPSQRFVSKKAKDAAIVNAQNAQKAAAAFQAAVNLPNDVVKLGSLVTVYMDGKSDLYMIVDPSKANPMGNEISYDSPIGKAMLGHKRGEKVIAKTPNGDLKIEIMSIDN